MATICTLNDNLLRTTSCGYSLPEVVDLYLANFSEADGKILITSSEDGEDEITGITSGVTFYHIEPAKDSASFSDELGTGDGGNKYRVPSVTFSVTGQYSKKMHAALDALSLGRFFVVAKTADGNYLGLGRITGLEAETATLAGGSDSNGLQITLTRNTAESPLPLSNAAVTAMLAAVKSND